MLLYNAEKNREIIIKKIFADQKTIYKFSDYGLAIGSHTEILKKGGAVILGVGTRLVVLGKALALSVEVEYADSDNRQG